MTIINSAFQRVNAAGVDLIKRFEELHLKPYLSPAKVWCIGYGHSRTVRANMEITKVQAEQLLDDDLRLVEHGVKLSVTVPLTDNQFSALVCFAYNVGMANFKDSTMIQLLNRGWYDQVPAQLMRWNRILGEPKQSMSRRRNAEANLWTMEE